MATTPSLPESTKRVFICTEYINTSQIGSHGLGRCERENTHYIPICNKHVSKIG